MNFLQNFFNLTNRNTSSTADIAFERLMNEIRSANLPVETIEKIRQAVLEVLKLEGYTDLSLNDLTAELKLSNETQTGISVNIDTEKLSHKP